MNVSDALEKYGLERREAELFIYLLRHGDQTAFSAAKALKLPKTTVYNTLDALRKRGFVNQWKKNNVAHYGAESPRRLIAEPEAKIDIISAVMPQLLALSSNTQQEVLTKQYEGVDGFRTVYDDILDSMERRKLKHLYAISNPRMLDYVPRFFPKWLKRRMDLGIYTRLIATSHLDTPLPAIYESNPLRETRLAPENISFNSTIDIYGDTVALFSFEDTEPKTTIVIESKAVTAIFLQFFEILWSTSSPAKLRT